MNTTAPYTSLQCLDCEATHDPGSSGRCPDCGGALDPVYEHTEPVSRETLAAGSAGGLAGFEPVLPFPADTLVTAGEGGTPLIEVPGLADDLGVASVYVKDEGHSTTGALHDREMALAVTAASEAGATTVALPTMGNGGQAAAAYAARAGLTSQSFVPSRVPFVNKAMVNVHGGDMSVVEGRYADAAEAFTDASADEDWHTVAPFETPFRHEGAKTMTYEIARGLDWTAPDAVVHPTGHGTGLLGLEKGSRELRRWDLVETVPRLYAAQTAGCDPIAEAWADGVDVPRPCERPDTICGPLEIPDPAGGPYALDALAATDGDAVAADDETILAGAVSLAEAGITASVTGGAAVAGARALADRGTFAADDVVVLVNSVTGNKEADLLRSHLMSKGI
jgi:threonine synthase